MPGIVLYTLDFEPITIIDLPPWAMDMLSERERVTLPVETPLTAMPTFHDFTPPAETIKTVTIRVQRICWIDRRVHLVFVTGDDVNALLLEPSFLPGQRRVVNQMERRAGIAEKLLSALLRQLDSGRGI